MAKRILPCIVCLLITVALPTACSRGPSEQELALQQLTEQLNVIQTDYQALGAARTELETSKATLAELEGIEERKRTDEQKEQLAALGPRIEELSQQVDAGYEELQTKLADYLNTALNEFPQEESTRQGLRIYAEESIRNAEDTVAKAGDYKKAIDTVETAKGYYEAVQLEPYQGLIDKLSELEQRRYITEERFAMIKRGMTQDEVKETAGVPYHGNVREDPESGVEFWVYPKREGGAAAVYFDKKDKVYNTNFDAVKTKVVD